MASCDVTMRRAFVVRDVAYRRDPSVVIHWMVRVVKRNYTQTQTVIVAGAEEDTWGMGGERATRARGRGRKEEDWSREEITSGEG